MKTTVTNDQIASFARRSAELYGRMMKGTLSAERVLAGLQALIEEKRGISTLEDMIAVGRYDRADPEITKRRFPVNPERFTTAGITLCRFNKVMKTEDVVAEMARGGYEPSTIEPLLALGAENPDWRSKFPIVALGSSQVDPYGYRRVLYLCGPVGQCRLCLDWDGPEDRWHGYCWFLAARK